MIAIAILNNEIGKPDFHFFSAHNLLLSTLFSIQLGSAKIVTRSTEVSNENFYSSGSSSIPGIVSTVPALNIDVTTLKGCMTDPTATSCTGTYTTTSSMPVITATMAALPALSADVMTLKGCMTSPTDSSCTGTFSAATNLNKLVDSLSKCMTNPTASDCTSVYSDPTTLPKVAHFIIF